MNTKILFITALFILLSSNLTAQVFDKEYYLAFKTSDWKGNAAPPLQEIKIQQSPLNGSALFYDQQGKVMSGQFHIIIHAQKYIIADISKGIIDGELRLYSYNQEIERYNLKKGIYHGKQYSYPSNEIFTYNNGIITNYISFYDNKQLKKELNYINGKIEGNVIEYNKDGKIIEKKHYSNGVLNGEATSTNPQGYIKQSYYKNGVLNGQYQELFANGNVSVKGAYENDKKNGIWIYYEENGNIKEEIGYQNGKYQGYIKRYIKGTLFESTQYVDGKRHGKRLYYRGTPPNMKLSEEENYLNGKLDGIVKRFNERNILYFEANYKNGFKTKTKEYHPTTGLIRSETLYRDGSSVAEKIYDKKGILKYLLLQNEQGYLTVVQEYNTLGKVTKKNSAYKKAANIKLVEDEWGIIDIP